MSTEVLGTAKKPYPDVAQLHYEETLEEIAKITTIEMAKKKEKDCFMAKIMEIKRTNYCNGGKP